MKLRNAPIEPTTGSQPGVTHRFWRRFWFRTRLMTAVTIVATIVVAAIVTLFTLFSAMQVL